MAKKRDDYSYDGRSSFSAFGPPIRSGSGIKSRNQRGAFASNWWSKRFIALLEGYGLGTRLERGRNYARVGQVLNIIVDPGLVRSQVQGSRPRPYDVRISVTELDDAEWERVLDAISGQAIFAAQLLNGEMPQEIEEAFASAGVPLFPQDADDIDSDCTCPDMANPCKHIAAVYYLLAEQFDVDPFLIFRLRGRSRDQVIEALRARRAAALREVGADEAMAEAPPAPNLSDHLADFWGDMTDWSLPSLRSSGHETDVLRRFGTPANEPRKPLEAIYQAMSDYGYYRLLGPDDEPDA